MGFRHPGFGSLAEQSKLSRFLREHPVCKVGRDVLGLDSDVIRRDGHHNSGVPIWTQIVKKGTRMPIFLKDDKAILFVHIPKTGGSSIKKLFESMGWNTAEHCPSSVHRKGDPNWYRVISPQHQHAIGLKQLFRIERFDGVLMFVRNPVDRLSSEYFWRNRTENIKLRQLPLKFRSWWKESREAYLSDHGYLDNHLRPQWEFLLQEAVVGNFEHDISSDFVSHFLTLSGLSVPEEIEIPNVNQRRFKSNFEIGGSELQEIEEFYAKDFEVFGYERATG